MIHRDLTITTVYQIHTLYYTLIQIILKKHSNTTYFFYCFYRGIITVIKTRTHASARESLLLYTEHERIKRFSLVLL